MVINKCVPLLAPRFALAGLLTVVYAWRQSRYPAYWNLPRSWG